MQARIHIILLACLLASTANAASSCNRSCLEKHLEAYLDALISHAPERADLFIGFRQTENSLVVPLGEGLWTSVTDLGILQRRYYDPHNSTAAYFGLLRENDRETVAALRMKVKDRQIIEAEWILAREEDDGIEGAAGEVPFNLDILRETLPEVPIVPRSRRLSRDALIAITNSYFDGISSHNAHIVRGHPGCTRYENGLPTTGQPLAAGQLGHEGRWDCRTQADFGVALVANRNYFVADEAAQVVLVNAVFLRDRGNPKRRNHFIELFHIDDGHIRSVHAAMYYAPADLPVPNWPPYGGTFPLD